MPKMKSALDSELGKFQTKFKDAAEPLIQRLEASEPNLMMPASTAAELDAIGKKMVSAAQQYEASSYCPAMLNGMKQVTAESLRATIEKQFGVYTERAKAKTPVTADDPLKK